MPSRTPPLTDAEPQPAERTAARTPSSAPVLPPAHIPHEEVTPVAHRIRRALSALTMARIDAERIDAHRDAVQRELVLSRPIL
ncbi:hypothetical protein [Sinomonas atrocyanea]|uniref:hypothetical protein n=1 Tax=Sinomonas atrocyanea TaxID=37927 RepID=UPI00277FEC89|nr:hypothetical protein [Sinomonas atrocyanea]MDQ0260736.1 hypothetical protein [Sinomonas atrocyanea]MDR6622281.1 hypothetical protein [Sinomonas atrocyanea]